MWIKTAALVSTLMLSVSASELTVRYYNEAGISSKTLDAAVESAGRAMRSSGIQVRWVNCYANPDACRAVTTAVLDLNLAASAGAVDSSFNNAAFSMGYSLLPENGAGVYAKVMWNRVMKYAQAFDVPAATVLGNVMAHEIGHLLLNTGSHSHSGIMKAVWSEKDTAMLAGGRLAFQGHEAAAMRRRLAGGIR